MKTWLVSMLSLGLTLAATSAVSAQQDPPHHLVGIGSHDPHAITVALERGIALDCQARHEDGTMEIVATDADLQVFRQRAVSFRVLQHHLEHFYAQRLLEDEYIPTRTNPPFGGGGMGGYFTFAEIKSILDDFHSDYPSLFSAKVSLGVTDEGRNLWMVKISDNVDVDENEPEVRFDAMHHAREPMSMTSLLYYMDWLLENYGTDPLATFLVDEREIFFVPVVNPDGYEYNRSTNPNGGGMWRKNRHHNGGSSYGVDLNRNYSYKWGYDNGGSSGNRDSETYRGSGPTSEQEIQAMEAFISSRNFRTANSAHSYSDLWLYSWGYQCSTPPDDPALNLQSKWICKDNGYVYGPICPTLYAANGVTVDYDYAVHGIFSATIEIGGSSDGFWPTSSRIVPLCEENMSGYQRMSMYAAAGVEDDGVQWNETSGDNDGYFEAGEEFQCSLSLVNPGVSATLGSCTATVSVTGTAIDILDGIHDFGVIAGLGGSADNNNDPLHVKVSDTASNGDSATLTVHLAWDAYDEIHALDITVGEPLFLGVDDLEKDYGWTFGLGSDTNTTGSWERSDPQRTTSNGNTIQPEDDHSSSGTMCAVTDGRSGSGAGSYDVDNGYTTLISPQFDLEDVPAPTLSYWRWYASDDDPFTVEISNDDGGNWSTVEVLNQQANSWTEVAFQPGSILPPTDRMRMRFTAIDDPNNSLTEGLIDDLSIASAGGPGSTLWRYGSPQVGDPLQLGMFGPANTGFLMYAATMGGYYDLGDLGVWELEFTKMFKVMNGSLDSQGRWRLDTALPNNSALSGVEIHLQTMVLQPGGAHFSNAVDMLVE